MSAGSDTPEGSGLEKQQQQRPEVLIIDLPGLKLRITDQTLRTIFEFTGNAWRWVVYAVAAGIFLYSLGYTYQAFSK